MKTLRKTSFDNFDRLSITEASQLYGGNGYNSTLPADSTSVNRNDSIQPIKTTPKVTHSVSGGVKYEQNKSTTVTTSYTYKNGKYSVKGDLNYNTDKKWSGGITGTISW